VDSGEAGAVLLGASPLIGGGDDAAHGMPDGSDLERCARY